MGDPLVSIHGNALLEHAGHTYQKHSERQNALGNNTIYYRCIKRRLQPQCTATARLCLGQVMLGQPHNHGAAPIENAVRRVVNRMRAEARNGMDQPMNIIARNLMNVPLPIQQEVPRIRNLQRMISWNRAAAMDNPQNPANIQALHIPPAIAHLPSGELFLKCDDVLGNERILIFSTDRQLNLLEQSNFWLGDGTFAAVPRNLFSQLYTLHFKRGNNVFVGAYILMTHRTQAMYTRVFTLLLQLRPNCAPMKFMSDFEVAVQNAMLATFPAVQCSCCFFHFSQSLWRKVQSLPNMRHRYEIDQIFNIHVRMISALAYLPVQDVIPAYTFIRNLPYYQANAADFNNFWGYFERTWVGVVQPNGQRGQPLFDLALWNCHDAVLTLEECTNNHSEGWNRGYYARFTRQRMPIWTLIRNLKLDATVQCLQIMQTLAGNPPAQGRAEYAALARTIQATAINFQQQQNIPFDIQLRTYAHLINNP